jgi:hypothetical protein
MLETFTGLSAAYQIAYVTRDLSLAADRLELQYGVKDFLTMRLQLELRVPAARASVNVGIAWVDDLQIEVIEPVDGAIEIYAAALPDTTQLMAPHHMAMRVAGLSQWEDLLAQLPEHKVALVGGRDEMRFVYVDERNTLGHYLEYVWMSDAFLTQHPIWDLPKNRRAASVKG